VVGAGEVANGLHLPAWRNVKEAHVVAVCDVNKQRAERIASHWRIARVCTDFSELLDEAKDAIVDLCTPPATHATLACKAMQSGHHVVLEKPMALTASDTEAIYNEYEKRKPQVRLCVIQNFLFEPAILSVKSIVGRRQADILSIDIRMLHTPNDVMISDIGHWSHSLPGGRFGECLIHPVYVLRNLMGARMRVRDVYAAKRGSYEWVNYDELHASFDHGGKFGSIYISFNASRWTMPMSIRVHTKDMIVDYDGTNLTCTSQGGLMQGYLPGTRVPKVRILEDVIGVSSQILKSAVGNASRIVTGGWRAGMTHEGLFKSFVGSLLRGEQMPYGPEESREANLLFLETLARLHNAEF